MSDARISSVRARTVNVQRFSHTKEIRWAAIFSSVVVAMAERVEVRAPFDGQQRLLPIVAVLAGGNDVAAHAASPAPERNEVIHGECPHADVTAAVIAAPRRDAALPPSAGAELARPRAL